MFMKLELHAVITWVKKAKAWYLIQCRLMMHSSALQPWKGQLTGIGYSTAVQASGAHCPRNGLWTRSYAARRTTPQSAMLGLHPIIHVPNYAAHLSTPEGWMAELAMLADR